MASNKQEKKKMTITNRSEFKFNRGVVPTRAHKQEWRRTVKTPYSFSLNEEDKMLCGERPLDLALFIGTTSENLWVKMNLYFYIDLGNCLNL